MCDLPEGKRLRSPRRKKRGMSRENTTRASTATEEVRQRRLDAEGVEITTIPFIASATAASASIYFFF